MKCPKCKHDDTRVIESRDVAEGESIRRRRQCEKCSHRYTTYERLERPNMVVIKKDQTRQLFSRDKLATGIIRSCEKTPVTALEIEELVSDIEKQIYQTGDNEISSIVIGQMVMEGLADLNNVAYVRFASVYKQFTDIESFDREVAQLRKKLTKPKKGR